MFGRFAVGVNNRLFAGNILHTHNIIIDPGYNCRVYLGACAGFNQIITLPGQALFNKT